jgi:hypothetical protein
MKTKPYASKRQEYPPKHIDISWLRHVQPFFYIEVVPRRLSSNIPCSYCNSAKKKTIEQGQQLSTQLKNSHHLTSLD